MKRDVIIWGGRGLILALSFAATAALAQETSGRGANWRTTNSRVADSTAARFQEAAKANEPVSIVVTLNLNNEQALDQLITEQRTPGNPHYRHWLSSDESTQQFGPTVAQAQAVANYLKKNGFTNIQIAPNRVLVTADGTAESAQIAFNTQIGVLRGNDGRRSLGNMTEIQVPAELSQVHQVLGLDTTAVRVTHSVPESELIAIPVAAAGTGTGGTNGYYPDGFSTVYNRPSNQTGRNTVVAVIGWGNMTPSVNDLQKFQTARGIAAVPTSVVYYPGSASTITSDQSEWSMDAQAIVGISGGVKQLIFYSTGGDPSKDTYATVLSNINRVVSDNAAKVINMSWTWSPPPECGGPFSFFSSHDAVFKLGVSQGQTFAAATGDNGSYPCSAPKNSSYGNTDMPATLYPAISPYVIAIGGTTLSTGTNLAYVSESAWPYSGGGISSFESKPYWQSSLWGVYRQVPDLAFNADRTYSPIIMYMNGATAFNGGTSLAAPLFVGAWAVLETATNNTLGFAPELVIYPYINQLYALSAVHDITSGSNGYYTAKTGYDNATGWGSFDIAKMLGFVTPLTVTASVTGTGGTISPSGAVTANMGSTLTFTLAPSPGYQASVGGTCGGSLSGNTYTTKAITANCTVIGTFALGAYTVTPSVSGTGGAISPATNVSVKGLDTASFTLTPSAGYITSSVDGTCGGTLTGNTFKTNAITANCTVVAKFVQGNYTVSPSVSGTGGTISPATAVSAPSASTVSFTLTPDSGYVPTVDGTCGGTLNGNVYTTQAITANCTVVASFAPAGGGGVTSWFWGLGLWGLGTAALWQRRRKVKKPLPQD